MSSPLEATIISVPDGCLWLKVSREVIDQVERFCDEPIFKLNTRNGPATLVSYNGNWLLLIPIETEESKQ